QTTAATGLEITLFNVSFKLDMVVFEPEFGVEDRLADEPARAFPPASRTSGQCREPFYQIRQVPRKLPNATTRFLLLNRKQKLFDPFLNFMNDDRQAQAGTGRYQESLADFQELPFDSIHMLRELSVQPSFLGKLSNGGQVFDYRLLALLTAISVANALFVFLPFPFDLSHRV